MIELHWVEPKHLPHLAPAVANRLAEAIELSDGKYTPQDVMRELTANNMQLWLVCRADDKKIIAAVVTEIINYPSKRVCAIHFAGGQFGDVSAVAAELDQKLGDWARSHGCASMEIYGRSGWKRVLGWEPLCTVLRKEL